MEGVDTTHYRTSDAQAQKLLTKWVTQGRTVLSGTAEFWVTNRDGHIKQYVVMVNSQDSAGQKHTETSRLLVTSENQPVTIDIPPADQVLDMQRLAQPTPTPQK